MKEGKKKRKKEKREEGDGQQPVGGCHGRQPCPRQKSCGAILVQNGILELSKRGFGERS